MAGANQQAQQGGNIFDQSASAYSMGVGGLAANASGTANPYVQQAADQFVDTMNPAAIGQTMNQFMNPYQNQVIDQMTSRMRDSRNEALNTVQSQAVQSRAFGGARQGLVEAQTFDMFGRAEDEAVARALQSGFSEASQFGLNRIGQIQQGASGLGALGQSMDQTRQNASQGLVGAAQAGLGMGQSINSGQAQAGAQQQNLIQQVLSQAAGQTENYINQPQNALAQAMAGLQGNPLNNNMTQTSQYNPGLFDYLSFGSGMAGGSK